MLFDLRDLVEQLLVDTRHSWEYTLHTPSSGNTTLLGTVLYSRHCKGGAYEGSFRYWINDETTLVLYDTNRDEKFSVDLAQPDSFQLASGFIRRLWDRQQPSRLPIDGSR